MQSVAQQQPSINVGSIVASTSFLAQSAAIAASTVFTVGAADKLYRIDLAINAAAAGVQSVSPNVLFTDAFGNVQTVALNGTQSGNGGATATFTGQSLIVRAKAGSNIQVSTTLGGTGGAPNYNLYVNVTEI